MVKKKVIFFILAAMLMVFAVAPAAFAQEAYVAGAAPAADVVDAGAAHYYADVPDFYTAIQATQSLSISLDTAALFSGAQTMLDALTSPYLLIAGFGLGVAILGAIMAAVTKLRIG